MDQSRKTLIIGAAIAMVHQIEMGSISTDRTGGVYNENAPKWGDFKHLQECLRNGNAPDLNRLTIVTKDAFAHLRQSMRVDYDEWFEIFPWLEKIKSE